MKVEDYTPRTRDIELWDFMDNVQIILNNGLYEFRLVMSVPSWSAQEGESCVYWTVGTSTTLGANRRFYIYINGVWTTLAYSSGAGGAIICDADGDTGLTPEWSADEDVIRYYVQDTYAFSMSSLGFGVLQDRGVCFNGPTFGTAAQKMVYVSSSSYLTLFTNGSVRMEM